MGTGGNWWGLRRLGKYLRDLRKFEGMGGYFGRWRAHGKHAQRGR